MLRRLILLTLFPLWIYSASAVTFLVTTNADSGPGSLRQAILDANATPGPDAIYFGIGSGPKIIQVLSPLPTITDRVELNGATQLGYTNSPIITLVGTGDAQGAPGLELATTGTSIVGLMIHGFRFSPGILLSFGGGHVIAGCHVGSFTPTLGNGQGIVLSNSFRNQIGLPGSAPNVVFRNFGAGILLSSSSSNVLEGNYVGTDPAGFAAAGNQTDGIQLIGAEYNTIGGISPGAGNLISGNGGNGIYLNTSPFNVIEGNYIGCDVSGAVALRNRLCGINLFNTSDTTIGGITVSARNIISGNTVNGVEIAGAASANNIVQGNYIGVAASGLTALGNLAFGVFLNGTADNLIGGAESGARNVISGNPEGGIGISGGSDNIVQGNFVGLDYTGTERVANGVGISITDSAGNLIGGTEPASRNVISGSVGNGIAVTGSGAASDNLIFGNYIGTDMGGTLPLPNARGVFVSGSSRNNLIQSNLVSGNVAQGIYLFGYSNVVGGNFVGTEKTGRRSLPNGAAGLGIGLIGNTIGGVEPEARNVISGNAGNGIEVYPSQAASSYGHVIQGNLIGTKVSGTEALPNGGFGIAVGASLTTIGGSEPTAANVISGNRDGGILIGPVGSLTGFSLPRTNVVHGNFIGTDRSGVLSVPNHGPGVLLDSFARNNFVGGTDPGEGNVIAFNAGAGVMVTSNSTGHVIVGNSIHSNTGLGIDLAADGVTANDAGDGDTGANHLQNHPVITNVVYLSNNTIIQGYLRSTTNGSFSIDVYANVATEQSGYGEGQFYLGNVDVDTDESGFTEFAFSTPNVFSNQFFTATALNYDTGDTSEFSAAMGGIRITSIERISSQYRVSFSTRTNHTYMLEYANNLNSSMSWSPVVLPPQPIQGTGGIVTVSDLESTATMRVYRVFEQP